MEETMGLKYTEHHPSEEAFFRPQPKRIAEPPKPAEPKDVKSQKPSH